MAEIDTLSVNADLIQHLDRIAADPQLSSNLNQFLSYHHSDTWKEGLRELQNGIHERAKAKVDTFANAELRDQLQSELDDLEKRYYAMREDGMDDDSAISSIVHEWLDDPETLGPGATGYIYANYLSGTDAPTTANTVRHQIHLNTLTPREQHKFFFKVGQHLTSRTPGQRRALFKNLLDELPRDIELINQDANDNPHSPHMRQQHLADMLLATDVENGFYLLDADGAITYIRDLTPEEITQRIRDGDLPSPGLFAMIAYVDPGDEALSSKSYQHYFEEIEPALKQALDKARQKMPYHRVFEQTFKLDNDPEAFRTHAAAALGLASDPKAIDNVIQSFDEGIRNFNSQSANYKTKLKIESDKLYNQADLRNSNVNQAALEKSWMKGEGLSDFAAVIISHIRDGSSRTTDFSIGSELDSSAHKDCYRYLTG